MVVTIHAFFSDIYGTRPRGHRQHNQQSKSKINPCFIVLKSVHDVHRVSENRCEVKKYNLSLIILLFFFIFLNAYMAKCLKYFRILKKP